MSNPFGRISTDPYVGAGQGYGHAVSTGVTSSLGQSPADQALMAAAKAGDPAALAKVQQLAQADVTDGYIKGYGSGDGTAPNLWRDWSNQNLGTQYQALNSRHGPVGDVVGGALKALAPVGAALIPSLGPFAAGLLAAGGNSAGQLVHGDKFNPVSAGLAGLAGGAGAALLGGQGANAFSGAAEGAIPAAPSAAGLPGIGDVSSVGLPAAAGGAASVAPVAGGVAAGAAPAAAGAAGTLGKIGSTVAKNLPLIGGVLGTITGAGQQSHANDLQNQAIQTAMQDWQARAPVRQAAISKALAPLPTAPDLSYIYANSSNPYAKVHP